MNTKKQKYIVLSDNTYIPLTDNEKNSIAIVDGNSLDTIGEGILLSDLLECWNKQNNTNW